MRASLLGCLLAPLLAAGGHPAGADSPPSPSQLELSLAHPVSGAEVDPSEPAFLAGDAFLRLSPGEGLDAMLVVDRSASTGSFAGDDVNGDGVLDRSFGGDDSVLAAELVAVRRVVEELAPTGARLGLVAFSGRPPPGMRVASETLGEAALLVLGPTADRVRIAQGLQQLRGLQPLGMTDMGAGLSLALEVLSQPVAGRRDRVVLFFTDGAPTSPHGSTQENLEAALRVASQCAAREVRVHTFAIGREAIQHAEAPIRIADLTAGYFTPVQSPADLAGLARQVARASVRRVSVVNRSTGRSASELVLGHDGSWSALVAIRPGANVIRVAASALGGAEVAHEIVIQGRPGAPPQEIPPALRPRLDAVLAQRLDKLRQETEALKSRLRRELSLKLERERQRLNAQRELELQVER